VFFVKFGEKRLYGFKLFRHGIMLIELRGDGSKLRQDGITVVLGFGWAIIA
jgi:hypothetical protein